MDIQRFVNKHNPQERIFHSNAYARVARGKGMGSMDTQTFSQRLDVHHNRQEVGHYGASMIGRSYMSGASRGHMGSTPRQGGGGSQAQRYSSHAGTPRPTYAPKIQPRFHEPPNRGYNPYS